ncbi:Telomere length regulator protein rif1 [Cytospora mali]|uniref:Telomere length regulator protein rif1 n=1 Tax=Cytospora mali TaxID=578113 RepID=A0A194W316_CYTMA|nr:Telomere length regulator protein rif1 [Valsa mali]
MLESTLQQLAGADRESKVDAYTMLFRGLKTSSNLPDRIALQNKMPVFMQFIQRDLAAKAPNGAVDNLLVTSALKLLHIFLHFHGIASSIPYDFGVFLIDHCIRSFEDEQAPKEVIKHLMQALYLQNFQPDIMTADRVDRLVAALHNLENHLTGKSIIQIRIVVYEKLVNQCPQQMAVHSDWLHDLFTDMLSGIPEIRSAAIKLGLSAAFTLNRDRRCVSRVLDLLNLSLEDKKYVEEFTERLHTMLKNPQQSTSVPRIWSVVTLFIPKPQQWDYFQSWSQIIQLSFNNSNTQVKKEANLAWSRFTYRLHLDGRLNLKLLRDPLLSLLKRKGLRDSVLGSIRNFYYYAFKPDMNLRMMDETWDSAVAPLMRGLIVQGQEDAAGFVQAAAIMTGLIDCKTRRVWKENRIEDQTLVKDDELPAIEPKWIRANSSRVFDIVSPILEHGFAELSTPDSQFRKLWQALVDSVASASTKDVKLHDDTAKFVANVFTFLLKAWTKGPDSTVDGKPYSPSQFLDSTRELILILIRGLGLLPNPFAEKQLLRTKNNNFIVPGTQTHRSSKAQGSRRPPLHHLFCVLSNIPPTVPDDDAFAGFFQAVFAPFFADKSESAQAGLAQELLHLLPMDAACAYGPWTMAVAKISTSLESSQHSHQSTASVNGSSLGHEIRDIARVLERGLKSVPNLPWQQWLHLFQALCHRVKDEAGDSGVALAVIEPLAAVLRDLIPSIPSENGSVIATNCVRAAIELVTASTQPLDKQAPDTARRRLWGTSNAGSRPASFDPFDNLYKLLTSVLGRLYADLKISTSDSAMKLLDEVKRFVDRGNRQLLVRALVAIQDGLVCWLEDKDRRITRTDFPGVTEAARSLWQRLCNSLIDDASANSLHLDIIEPVLCAAFNSTHRDIVRITAEMWNRVYEDAEHIEYPEALKTVLASLGTSVDLVRPGLDILDEDSGLRLNFAESQEDLNLPIISLPRSEPSPRSRRSTSRRSATPGSAKVIEGVQRSETTTPLARVKSKGRTPRPKLRHEDSQVQFAAIESSPAPTAQESQLLTERQLEIRERQRERAALFPEIRSSPSAATKKAKSTTENSGLPPAGSPGPLRASTPEQDGGFEDYLASTPTPRRGKPVMLPEQDQDMADPPSSPPEPRSYRLLAELKSKANNTNSLDEWQFSSSPVSGSPILAQLTVSTSQPMVLDDVDEELRLDEGKDVVDKEDPVAEGVHEQKDVTSSQLVGDPEVIEETTIFENAEEAEESADILADLTTDQSSIMPFGRILRSKTVQMTPKSDKEGIVNVPSLSLSPTSSQRVTRPSPSISGLRRSSRNSGNSQSFSVSDSFEDGMRDIGTGRIEIGIRSSPKKKGIPSYENILPKSPEEKHQVLKGAEIKRITEGAETKKPRRGRSANKNSRILAQKSSQDFQDSRASLDRPSTPVTQLAAQESVEISSPASGIRLRKRKRSFSDQSSGNKRRHQEVLSIASLDEVPDSQPAAVVEQDRYGETQTEGKLHENEKDVSMGSDQSHSPIELPASQELPLVIPEPVEDQRSQPEESMYDDADFMDDEEAIQSQLAREGWEATASQVETTSVEHKAAAPLQELLEQEHEELIREESAELGEPESSKFDRLMDLLQNGLDMLMSAEFTREETYKVEDMFMDMKHELYQAEKRGRN